jgi:hypothetical protein
MKCFLLCLVAMLLLFPAYCKPYVAIAYPLALRNPGPDLSGIFNIGREANSLPLSDSQLLRGFFRIDHDLRNSFVASSFFYKSCSTVYELKNDYQVQRQINRSPLSWHLTLSPTYSDGTTVLNKEQLFKNFQQVNYREIAFSNTKKERTGFGRGARTGAIIGAGIGVIAGFAYTEPSGQNFISSGAGALMGAVAGAIIGVIIGGTIGALTKKRS